MYNHILEERMEGLHQRLRVLILQNAREETEYDVRFLQEVRQLADEILRLKTRFQTVSATHAATKLRPLEV